MFYDPATTFSHNCFLNFVVSRRGMGKTYSTLKYLIKRYKEQGEEFVYVRRTAVELQKAAPLLFKALEADEVIRPGEFICEGYFILHRTFDENNQVIDSTIAGYTVALSRTTQFKSIAFPKVQYILVEEFIDENNRYLRNEVENLLSIIETVARMRTIRVMLLGNLITKYNPYFNYFDLDFNYGIEFIKDKKRSILIHNYENEDFQKKKKETPFARMIENTAYGSFILDNKNILDSNDFIRNKKISDKVPLFNFRWEGMELCAYSACDDEGLFGYIQKGHNKAPNLKAFNMDKDLKENYQSIRKYGHYVSIVLNKFLRLGRLYFEDGNIKIKMQEYFSVSK